MKNKIDIEGRSHGYIRKWEIVINTDTVYT